MNLFKNGFVVAEMNVDDLLYRAWPLFELRDDKTAQALTDFADETWFFVYNMQHIVPDQNYVKQYLNYCKSIDLQVEVLLFESWNDAIVIDDEVEICEVLGFDCIGNVYYPYLQTELDACMSELLANNIVPNKYGLLKKLEDVVFFIESRKREIASGINLEDFWEELPVRISIVNIP